MTTAFYDFTADILFRTAINLGQGKRLSVRSAIYDSVNTLESPIPKGMSFRDVLGMYMGISGFTGEDWGVIMNPRGGCWMLTKHRTEQIMSVLFTYEYLVQELGALRSPLDSNRSFDRPE